MPTWDASQYLKFADERTRPCRDLAARISVSPVRSIIDLGCGPGNSTAVLASLWPEAGITGLDNSQTMIDTARRDSPDKHWLIDDIEAWASRNGALYDIVFSNAALQWTPDHEQLYPKLLARARPGGALAIQVPGNFDFAAHRIMREIAAEEMWMPRFPSNGVKEWRVEDLAFYYDVLAPHAAKLDFWETEYLHVLPDAAGIVEWYRGSGLRPFLDALSDDSHRGEFLAEYLERIRQAYPPRHDGRVLFPFRRLFVIAYR